MIDLVLATTAEGAERDDGEEEEEGEVDYQMDDGSSDGESAVSQDDWEAQPAFSNDFERFQWMLEQVNKQQQTEKEKQKAEK